MHFYLAQSYISAQNVGLFQNTTNNSSSSSSSSWTNIAFSAITRSKKKSLVHPNNEQQDQLSLKKRKKRRCSPFILALTSILLIFFLGAIIIAIVIPLTRISTTTGSTHVCNTSNYTACSTVMYHNLNLLYLPPPVWALVSCCYVAPTMNQYTIEIAVQDDSGYWALDDVSATQGNGELISNGGFEYNWTNWTLTVYSNATSLTTIDSVSGNQLTGTAYLYGASLNAPVYVKQTFSIIPGQNFIISFWWNYYPLFGGGFGTSELTVTLT
ncbi:unnamed protein product [Rotaria sp. Silwood1]|nr:unnamed protein product [Rotaria sp. Silwood1]CAF1127953.1 unnamed protein product [Rotaria sp. Silwood1]